MLINDLKKILKGDVSAEPKILDEYSVDASIFKITPQAVVFPKDAEDVKNLVKFVSSKLKASAQGGSALGGKSSKLSLTARSAGTDMSGGPLNDSIVISFTKYFNHIKEIVVLPDDSAPSPNKKHSNILQNVGMSGSRSGEGSGRVMVEPGVYYRDLERALDEKGLLFPTFPASKDLCAIGGMVSNNSGGEKTLEYGKTEDYVESLKIVLADGEEHEIKPLSAKELQKKIKEKSFEGRIYKQIYELIEKNYEAIKKAKPDVSKNSAGYALWNVWDKKSFNLVKLIVGSQGTLGLVTEAKLRLVRKKKFSRLIVIFSKTLEPVPELVKMILPFKPESIESYDDKTLGLALKFLPSLIKMMKGNIIKLAFEFLPEFWLVLKGGIPRMAILVQLSSDDEEELNGKIKSVIEAAKKFPVQVRAVRNEEEAEKYWTIRRQSFALLHSHIKGLYAAPFVDDVIVKPEYLPEVLPKVNAILDEHKDKLIYTIAGHPGNGNFHIIPLVDLKDPEVPRIMFDSMEKIYQLVLEYGGSITAEHNDGLIRGPYLKMMYGEKIYKLFEEVKKIFDPLNIFNPRKKVGVDVKYAMEKIRK